MKESERGVCVCVSACTRERQREAERERETIEKRKKTVVASLDK